MSYPYSLKTIMYKEYDFTLCINSISSVTSSKSVIDYISICPFDILMDSFEYLTYNQLVT